METLPTDCRWILNGNWNFVEKAFDKSNPNGRIISVGEKHIFSFLVDVLGVEDVFPIDRTLKYTWGNKRKGDDRHLARIDRFCTFKLLGTAPEMVTEYYICGDSTHSDQSSKNAQKTIVIQNERLVLERFRSKNPNGTNLGSREKVKFHK